MCLCDVSQSLDSSVLKGCAYLSVIHILFMLVNMIFARYDGSQGQSFPLSDTHVPTTLQSCHWRHCMEPEARKLFHFMLCSVKYVFVLLLV